MNPSTPSVMTRTALAAMADADGTLAPGEQYLAALRISDPDTGRPLRDPILGPVGMVFGAGKAALLEPVATITLPSTGGVLALTQHRALVFGLGLRLGPTELVGAADRTDLALHTETFHASLVKREHLLLYAGEELLLDASVRASNPDLPAIRDLIPAR